MGWPHPRFGVGGVLYEREKDLQGLNYTLVFA